jgi:hypothetical protein
MRLGGAAAHRARDVSGGEPTYDVVPRRWTSGRRARARQFDEGHLLAPAEHVDSATQADWFVRVDGSDLVLIPASGGNRGQRRRSTGDPQPVCCARRHRSVIT